MKNQVIDILEDINPGVDYEARVDLVDSRCIDSLTMIAFVAELEDAFDVEIPPVARVGNHFNDVVLFRPFLHGLFADYGHVVRHGAKAL